MAEKIEAALHDLPVPGTSGKLSQTGEPSGEQNMQEKRSSGSSNGSFTSATTCTELSELEVLRKSINALMAKRSGSSISSVPKRPVPGFTNVIPPSSSALSDVTEVHEKCVKTVQHSTVVQQAPTPDSSHGGPSGQFLADWLNKQFVGFLKNIDGKDTLHMHVDLKVIELIAEGKYVDFAKLLKEERNNDSNIQVVTQNELTFFVPATHPPTKIENHELWDEASLVFQSIMNKYFPDKSGQLLEYKSYIEHISQIYDWSHVYAYDKHFCRVKEKNP